jgi:L-ornithine N5-oxygenase
MSQAVYGLDPRGRAIVLKDAKATNYSVVNPKTLASVSLFFKLKLDPAR